MKNPQTLAEQLYGMFPCEELKNIKNYACLSFVVMWCLGIEPDDIGAIMEVQKMINAKVIESDCTVLWANIVPFLTGRTLKSVEFEKIKVLKGIKDRTPVRYDYNGKSHWVGVENGKIAFNPLLYSVCVEKGKPAEKRVLTISGAKKA